ncbi:MAG: ABC transporter ATP-binding protein [Hyphomicrobiales bacterium]|nr:ABC transporter ATP-binding protein [Hyphomicrobiales bacterium]
MLEVRGLSKSFGGLQAVVDAALTVAAGEIVSLIGPNGAGKTTLFAMVSGFLKPDTGQILFDGHDLAGLRPHQVCRRGVVRTFQVVQPFPTLSVRDNIATGAHTRLRARSAALARAEEVAERLGMSAMLDQPAGDLTVAGRKRLELARALATGPRLLLLDEVMAGLNATEVGQVVEVVRGIRDSGITILLIEHVMQAVMSLSDRTYVINQGHIIAEGPPRQVAADPQVIEAYLGPGAAARIAGQAGVGDAHA